MRFKQEKQQLADGTQMSFQKASANVANASTLFARLPNGRQRNDKAIPTGIETSRSTGDWLCRRTFEKPVENLCKVQHRERD